jgi:hypothetical protein
MDARHAPGQRNALRAGNTDTRNYCELGKGSIHCGQRVATITVDHRCRLHLTVGKEPGLGEIITNRLSSQAAKRRLS